VSKILTDDLAGDAQAGKSLSDVAQEWVERETDHALLDARRGGFFRARIQYLDNIPLEVKIPVPQHEMLMLEALDALEERVKALESRG
jgi:hypothetical protein